MKTISHQETGNELRKAALAKLGKRSKVADISDDGTFQELINESQGVFELSDREFADILMVSRPTINRWCNGKNLPHRTVRKAVFTWIAKTALERLAIVERYEIRVKGRGA